jgi:hypothetical protein
MSINYETKYQVGQKLYYLSKGEVKETSIIGIKCVFKEGEYFNGSPELEEFYIIADCRGTYVLASNVENKYFLSKKDIIKHIIDQCSIE